MTDLKPCPFCGSENIDSRDCTGEEGLGEWRVACYGSNSAKDCNAMVLGRTRKQAEAAWNTRTQPDERCEECGRKLQMNHLKPFCPACGVQPSCPVQDAAKALGVEDAKPCPMCEGRKEVTEGLWGRRSVQLNTKPCPVCHGTGKQERTDAKEGKP